MRVVLSLVVWAILSLSAVADDMSWLPGYQSPNSQNSSFHNDSARPPLSQGLPYSRTQMSKSGQTYYYGQRGAYLGKSSTSKSGNTYFMPSTVRNGRTSR